MSCLFLLKNGPFFIIIGDSYMLFVVIRLEMFCYVFVFVYSFACASLELQPDKRFPKTEIDPKSIDPKSKIHKKITN